MTEKDCKEAITPLLIVDCIFKGLFALYYYTVVVKWAENAES